MRTVPCFRPDSLVLIMGGHFVSLCATALGVDGTYFGIELGVVKADKFVTKFPYNVLPHPVLGQVVASWVCTSCRRSGPRAVPDPDSRRALRSHDAGDRDVHDGIPVYKRKEVQDGESRRG